ncbi:MAG TPA: Wzz/FepE/Etk N-terminal domain-containing protein, partial [Rhodothermales bacterium]|nr:Wzz/FepE/Etk N-terminal domain-containing protein [Rhodothermales bacterium]
MNPNTKNGTALSEEFGRGLLGSASRDGHAAPAKVEVSIRELVELVRRESPGNVEPSSQAERALPIREVLDVLLRGRWVVAAVLAVVLGLTALYTFTRSPRYSATSYLLVHKEDTGLSSVLPSDAAALFRPERSLGNELFVLRRSSALARTVAERLIAQRRVPGTNEPFSILRVDEGETLAPALVVERLREHYVTVALEGDKVDALRVTATSEVPGEAAFIANVYAEAFVNLTRESSRAGYNASRRFLEEQVAEQDTVLAHADGALRGYMTTQNAVDPRAEAAELLRQLGTLRSERDAADVAVRVRRATVSGLERELEGIEPRLARRLASSVEREITTTQERIATLDGRVEQAMLRDPSLRASALPPDLAELQRQSDDLRARVQRLSGQLVEETMAAGGGPGDAGGGVQRALELRHRLIDERIALSGLEAERAVLGERVGTYERQLGSIPAETTDLARLERD